MEIANYVFALARSGRPAVEKVDVPAACSTLGSLIRDTECASEHQSLRFSALRKLYHHFAQVSGLGKQCICTPRLPVHWLGPLNVRDRTSLTVCFPESLEMYYFQPPFQEAVLNQPQNTFFLEKILERWCLIRSYCGKDIGSV